MSSAVFRAWVSGGGGGGVSISIDDASNDMGVFLTTAALW